MPRPLNPDLTKPWKISMPATLAGKVEFVLLDPIHAKPLYGARTILISALLEWWLARESGNPNTPHVPSLTELREQANA